MTVYADTSFLVSLYLPDAHSSRAWAMMASHPRTFLTPLHEVEFVNAIELAVFRKLVHRSQARRVLRDFEQDRAGVFALTAMPEDCFGRAERLARRHTARIGARSLDILHVAIASALKPDAFYTFDARQRRLARGEGLRVHP